MGVDNNSPITGPFPNKVTVESYPCWRIAKQFEEDYVAVLHLADLVKRGQNAEHMRTLFKNFDKVLVELNEHFVIYFMIQQGLVDWITGELKQ